ARGWGAEVHDVAAEAGRFVNRSRIAENQLHTTFQVGRLRCHALEAGRQALDGGAMFGVVPKPLWERRIPADERNRIPLALRCLLVEHDDGLVLIDTGIGNKEDAKFRDIYGVRNEGKDGRTLLEGETEVLPGLRCLPTPGHVPYHQSVLVESAGERVCFLADLVPTSAHLPLPWIMGYDLQPLVTLESKRQLYRRAEAEGWLLVFEHDAAVVAGRLGREGKGVGLVEALRAG